MTSSLANAERKWSFSNFSAFYYEKVFSFEKIYLDVTFPLAVKRKQNDTHRYRFEMSAQMNPISGPYLSRISTLSVDLQEIFKSVFLFYDFSKISVRDAIIQ